MLRVYCEDLAKVTEPELAAACRAWRQIPKSRRMPTPGQLLELCRKERGDVRERYPNAVPGRMIDGEWHPWQDCKCARCKRQEEFRKLEDVARWGKDSAWYTPELAREAVARSIPGLPPHPNTEYGIPQIRS